MPRSWAEHYNGDSDDEGIRDQQPDQNDLSEGRADGIRQRDDLGRLVDDEDDGTDASAAWREAKNVNRSGRDGGGLRRVQVSQREAEAAGPGAPARAPVAPSASISGARVGIKIPSKRTGRALVNPYWAACRPAT